MIALRNLKHGGTTDHLIEELPVSLFTILQGHFSRLFQSDIQKHHPPLNHGPRFVPVRLDVSSDPDRRVFFPAEQKFDTLLFSGFTGFLQGGQV